MDVFNRNNFVGCVVDVSMFVKRSQKKFELVGVELLV